MQLSNGQEYHFPVPFWSGSLVRRLGTWRLPNGWFQRRSCCCLLLMERDVLTAHHHQLYWLVKRCPMGCCQTKTFAYVLPEAWTQCAGLPVLKNYSLYHLGMHARITTPPYKCHVLVSWNTVDFDYSTLKNGWMSREGKPAGRVGICIDSKSQKRPKSVGPGLGVRKLILSCLVANASL